MAPGSSPSEVSSHSVIVGVPELHAHPLIRLAESQYRSGHIKDAIATCNAGLASPVDHEAAAHFEILKGMALFESGDCRAGIGQLLTAQEAARTAPAALQFAAAFALFIRQADFQSPDDSLIGLSSLRQLATVAGDPESLAGLHFALARLEGYRGLTSTAYRHAEIAARFADRAGSAALKCSLDVVAASLEFTAGNLLRARLLSEASLAQARRVGFRKYVIASQANLLAVTLCLGDLRSAERLAADLEVATLDLPQFRLGILDTIAQLRLHEGALDKAADLLNQCQQLIQGQQHPAPSWYELANQVTTCIYLERREKWEGVLDLVASAEPETDVRHLRAVRTGLLCAKARALARMGEPSKAEGAIAAALRSAPRGSFDCLIVLEATRGICCGLSGNWTDSAAHFERALAGCRAIGHRYHETWIERTRQSFLRRPDLSARSENPKSVELDRAAVLLGDVSAVLGAGHSVDMLGHALRTILEQTTVGPRVQFESESGRTFQRECSIDLVASPTGLHTLALRGSDKCLTYKISNVHSIEDVSLLKNVVDLLRIAMRHSNVDGSEEGEQYLWPDATPSGTDETVFQSPQMLELLRVAMRLASANIPILITGETGTGKEVLARFIHDSSPFARGPFGAFNCSTMPRDLVESQLFGHRRGAFTGALDSFPGVIRAAEHGTLFLDEIGDLELAVQPKLLRFLESSEIHPVGESKPLKVKVRIVAATNAQLDTLVEQGRFREDLFYRIGAARLVLPPLRDRKDEIPALAGLFVDRFARECGRRNLRLGDDFIAALLLYHWPGNIRQLANELRRVVAMASSGDTLRSSALSQAVARGWNQRPTTQEAATSVISIRLDQTLDEATLELEKRFIENALSVAGGRVAEAAQLLGLSRKGLFLKRRRQGLVKDGSALAE